MKAEAGKPPPRSAGKEAFELSDLKKDSCAHCGATKAPLAGASWPMTTDRRVLGVFVVSIALLSPAQAHIFARLLDAPLSSFLSLAPARALQVVILAAAMWVEPCCMAKKQTQVRTASFILLWALHLFINRRLLERCAGHPFAPALLAMMVALALAMHTALPLAHGRVAPDFIAYSLAAILHAVVAPLPWVETVRFGGIVGLGLVVAMLLRVALWVANDPPATGPQQISEGRGADDELSPHLSKRDPAAPPSRRIKMHWLTLVFSDPNEELRFRSQVYEASALVYYLMGSCVFITHTAMWLYTSVAVHPLFSTWGACVLAMMTARVGAPMDVASGTKVALSFGSWIVSLFLVVTSKNFVLTDVELAVWCMTGDIHIVSSYLVAAPLKHKALIILMDVVGYTFLCLSGCYGNPKIGAAVGAFALFIGMAFGHGLERIQRLTFLYANASANELATAAAHRRADSKLNHIVKNQCGAACARLQTLSRVLTSSDSVPSTGEIALALVQPIAEMQVVADWCLRREMLLQVELGMYQSRQTPCDVAALLRGALGDDGEIEAAIRGTLNVDEKVLHLVTVEALSNARKYGKPGELIVANAAFEEGDKVADDGFLRVTLENVPTEEPSSGTLSRAFKMGQSGANASLSSTGVGLASVKQCVHAARGAVQLKKRFDPNDGEPRVVFSVRLPASPVWSAPAAEAADEMARPGQPARGTLVCVGVDDDEVCRCMQEALMEHFLFANMQLSKIVGGTLEEQDGFLDLALGRVDQNGEQVPPERQRHADVALIDENIENEERGTTLLGSDLARSLHEQGFRGVVCLLTGSSDEHIARLAQSEGVDLALSKLGVRLELVAESITRALALKRGKRDSKESITRRSRHSVKGSYGQFDRRVRQHSI